MSLALTRKELIRPQNLIDGKWIDAADSARFPVTNPATGELIVEVANSGAADARAATDAQPARSPRGATSCRANARRFCAAGTR